MREYPSRSRYAIWRIGAGRGIDWGVDLPIPVRRQQMAITRAIDGLIGPKSDPLVDYEIETWYELLKILGNTQIEWAAPSSFFDDADY